MSIESICNQALSVVGWPRPIGSIWDGTRAARVALDNWAETRDALFEALRPEWARKDAVLIVAKQAPSGGYGPGTPWSTSYPPLPWQYEYSLPDDCVYPLQIKSHGVFRIDWRPRPHAFRYVGTSLLTDASPAILTYIWRMTDPDGWEQSFTEAMIQTLARKFAASLGREAPNADDAGGSGQPSAG